MLFALQAICDSIMLCMKQVMLMLQLLIERKMAYHATPNDLQKKKGGTTHEHENL
jgi:hypothetical protein